MFGLVLLSKPAPVVPETKIIEIRVTRWDILRGQRGCTDDCPLQRAIRRHVGRTYKVSVGSERITIRFKKDPDIREMFSRDLPEEARIFVSRFDHGANPGPLRVLLDFPTSVLR